MQEDKQDWLSIIDPNFIGKLANHGLMSVISTMREAHRGGTLILLPHERRHEFTSKNNLINIKYQFREDETQPRFMRLMLKTLHTLAEASGHEINQGKKLSWQEYLDCDSDKLVRLDEAWFELDHQMADFTAADGAVVMTDSGLVLGFGGMILGVFDRVKRVARALDREAEHCQWELTENVGARHRSVYYLCHKVPEALGIVVSQDGNARFIKSKDGHVTYWEHPISFASKIL